MLLTGGKSTKLAVLLPVVTMDVRDLIDRYKQRDEKARRSKGQASADRTKQPLSSSLAKGDLRLPCVCWGFLFPAASVLTELVDRNQFWNPFTEHETLTASVAERIAPSERIDPALAS
ncbi:MAG: hypothetical protein ACKO9Q_18190 [Pirellula sp.]